MTRRTLPLLLTALSMPRTGHAAVADAALTAAGWQCRDVPGRQPARFSLAPDGTIGIVAEDAVGFLLRPLADHEVPSGAYRLAWRWRVMAAPPPADVTVIGADDRPASVHLLFAGAGSGGGIGAVLRRTLRRGLLGGAFGGRAISYVWGGREPAGTVMTNPHLDPDGILVIQRGTEAPLNAWFDEHADPAADYRRAFGEAAPPPTHIALSSDTDDRGGIAAAELLPPRIVHA